MNKVTLILPSHIHHLCQITAGFLLLRRQGWEVEIRDQSRDAADPYHDMPIAFAEYRGQRIAYDVWDGYQNPPTMCQAAQECDFYFKRSFDARRNESCFGEDAGKIYPLGFNYHVTLPGSPTNEPLWKQLLKPLLGRAPDVYFTPEVFAGEARPQEGTSPRILFLTRLWEDDPQLDDVTNRERQEINRSRIQLIRTLQSRYGERFLGGLNDLPIARQLAPDLIVPAKLTERKHYMRLLHESDICIGTMGLHESIGWKTGEYVAAAKAIVNERMHYQVTGDFAEGKNYLSFTTAQECLDAVERLVQDPQARYEMQKANQCYYAQYLRPEALVANTLKKVDEILGKRQNQA